MLGYYLHLALRGLRRNGPLTALMIAAIGVGVGASVTLYTALEAMSADPIPAKSAQLFNVQVDNWGKDLETSEQSRDLIAYPDAAGLLRAKPALQQSPMYPLTFNITPAPKLTGSSLRARPAPRRQAATPIPYASTSVTTPEVAARTTSFSLATGSGAEGSPPWARIIAR